MDFFRLIPGVNVQDNGVRASFAGMSGFGTTNIQRDGVEASGGARWTANALTATHMSPELIGEIKVIVAPVDAEMGRGNAQIQFLTRSGANQFRGGFTERPQRRLDANTWDKNNDTIPEPGAWKPSAPRHNVHTFTGSYSGPIKRNKTFSSRSTISRWWAFEPQNALVPTGCGRNGFSAISMDGITATRATQPERRRRQLPLWTARQSGSSGGQSERDAVHGGSSLSKACLGAFHGRSQRTAGRAGAGRPGTLTVRRWTQFRV
jgi:hypothetical protein